MSRQRILVVTGFWPNASNSITGIFVVQQAAALVRAGYAVVVLVPREIGKGRSKPLAPSELGLDEAAVEFHEVPYLRLPEALSGWPGGLALNVWLAEKFIGAGVRRVLRDRQCHAAIIHGIRYCGFSIPGWSKLLPACISVVHGVDPFLARHSKKYSVQRAVHAMAQACKSVVLVGSSLKSHARVIGVPDDKARVVLNGAAIPPLSDVSVRQRPLSGARRCLSVSNLIPLKGVDLNLRALAALRQRRPELDWEYRVVGDGPMADSLRQLASTLGISDRVQFLCRLDYSATMREMADCDVFSLPSWGEAFGIVYLEAMARMRPVIGCLRNGAADIIVDGVEGYLVPPHDVDALSQALERLLENPDLCVKMGLAARKTAERFTWDANVSNLLEIASSPECGVAQ